jgi:hypothetical protein
MGETLEERHCRKDSRKDKKPSGGSGRTLWGRASGSRHSVPVCQAAEVMLEAFRNMVTRC